MVAKEKRVEHIVIRDYGRQGLAAFIMDDRANPGNICCWSTVVNYDSQPRGWRPDMHEVPMCYEEAHVSYYWKGKLVRRNDPRVAPFMERYMRWARDAYDADNFEVEFKVVERDHAKFRKERWKR